MGYSTAVELTNGTNQVLRNVVIGSFDNPLATGIVAKATLTNCHITAHITGGAMGIDLNDSGTSRIGANNVIWITTSNGTTTAADLPTGWQNTTVKNTTNDLRINGRRYYPATDEF